MRLPEEQYDPERRYIPEHCIRAPGEQRDNRRDRLSVKLLCVGAWLAKWGRYVPSVDNGR